MVDERGVLQSFFKGHFWYISSHTKLIQRGSEIDWLIGSALKWLDVFCCLWPLTWLSSLRGTVLASVDPICSVGVTAAAVHPHWGRRASHPHTHYRRHSTFCRAGSQNVTEMFMHMQPCNIQPRTTHMLIHPRTTHLHSQPKRQTCTYTTKLLQSCIWHTSHMPQTHVCSSTHKNTNVDMDFFLLLFK